MKVLMFGWEFPPKIYGGLAVASYGITKGLSLQGDMETTFCLPKPCGDEEKFLNIIGMNQVPIVWRDVNYDYLKSRLSTSTPEQYYAFHAKKVRAFPVKKKALGVGIVSKFTRLAGPCAQQGSSLFYPAA